VSASTGSQNQPQTAAALAARRTSAQAALQRVHDALTRMRREKTLVTVAGVARMALLTELDPEFQQFNG
jgi:hypothetical protein